MKTPRAVFGVPLRVWAGSCGVLWGARLVLAWVASRPVAVALTGNYEDRLLFEPGGMLLLEVFRLRAEVLTGAAAATTLLLLGAWVLLLATSTAILARLLAATPVARGADPWWRGALRALPRIAALALGLGALGLLVVFAGGVLTAALVRGPLEASPASRSVVLLGLLVCGALLAVAASVLFDLARGELVLGARLGPALRAATRRLRARLAALLGQRLILAALALSIVAAAAAFVSTQPLDSGRSGPLVAVFSVHRAAGALLATLHVLWLGLVARATADGTTADGTTADGTTTAEGTSPGAP
jgi:hypothetical protein